MLQACNSFRKSEISFIGPSDPLNDEPAVNPLPDHPTLIPNHMNKFAFILSALIPFSAISASADQKTQEQEALSTMKKVADWQLANPSKHRPTDWTQGAFYTGVMALYDVSKDQKYLDAMVQMGENNQWKPGPRAYHADDFAVCQAYCEMFMILKDPKMIEPTKQAFDFQIANPKIQGLEFGMPDKKTWTDRWSWCDALFMAPPALVRLYAITGDMKYLTFMDKEYWDTVAYLYDKDEGFFFRDSSFFNKKTPSGSKTFWGRGNGWVYAGLVRVLEYLPKDHPTRPKYVQLYKEMTAAVVRAQQPDSLWHPSLLDAAQVDIGETSGSAFFCYGLAWGVNNGLLEKAKYWPIVERSWKALMGKVKPDGMLGAVQKIGAAPDATTEDSTEVYGPGAFLLAGSEVVKHLEAAK